MSDASDVQIREIAQGDEEALGALFEALADDPGSRHFRPHALSADYARQLVAGIGLRRDRYFIAVQGGCVLGYAMLRGWDEGYDIPAFGVAVAPGARGRGLGRALLRYGLQLAGSKNASKVMLKVHPDNVDAKRLYESEGFVFESLAEDGVQLKGTVGL